MPSCHPRNSLKLRLNLGLNIRVIALACQVLSFQPCKLCPIAIKLQEEWRILWTSCRILFGSLVLSSVHSTIIITNTLINQTGSYYIITNFTLFGIEASYIPLHLDSNIVFTLNLGSVLVSCNNDIILVTEYN